MEGELPIVVKAKLMSIQLKKEAILNLAEQQHISTQTSLACVMNMEVQRLNEIISNRRSNITLKTLAKFCYVLKCQPGDIIEYVPPQPPDSSPSQALSF